MEMLGEKCSRGAVERADRSVMKMLDSFSGNSETYDPVLAVHDNRKSQIW